MKRHEVVLGELLSRKPADVHVSVITEAELRFGAAKSASPKKTLNALENFLAPLQIVDLASSDTITYASVRAHLEKAGTPIGPLDTFIAAHALARGMTLVTNSLKEFRRVPRLKTENWMA